MADETELSGAGRPAGVAAGSAETAGSRPETPQPAVAGAAELAPDIQKVVEEKLAAERAKHEKDVAALKSTYDKKLAAADRAKAERRQAEIQEALRLKTQDPETAANILAGHLAEMTAAEQAETAKGQWEEWQGRVLSEIGLDPDDEEVQAMVKGLGAPTSQDYAFSLLGEAGKLANSRAKKAQEEAAKLKESIPELVAAEVKRALAAGGIAFDLGGPGGGSTKQIDYSKRSATANIAEGLKQRAKGATKRREPTP